MQYKEEVFEKSIKQFEKDASLVLQSQSQVASMLDKFHQMESLVEDIEIRNKSITKNREWLVKAQTQLENLNHETDAKIKLLKALQPAKGEGLGNAKNLNNEDKTLRESIVQLRKQGWSIDEIAKTMNKSIGEVELILDLELSEA